MGCLDEEGLPLHLVSGLFSFVPWVLWQIVKSNIDVAKLVLQKNPKIHSHLIHLQVGQETEIGRVIHANAITITPGTVTLDIEGDHLLVHALTDEAAAEDASGAMDERVSILERGGKL
jgi:multicomponent Na+:H+ antiporter subunit E